MNPSTPKPQPQPYTPASMTQPAAPAHSPIMSALPGGEDPQMLALRAQATRPAGMVSASPNQASAAARPVAKSNPNSTQNTLQIAEIRDGIIIMNDGTFRSVIMAKSINFDLMSQSEQEAVEYSYQGFLNSLYFPVQIFIRSQKVDLQPYIDKLDKIRTEHDNMLLALLMEDYIAYIDALSEQTNIMDKKFYIVIPFSPMAGGGVGTMNSKNKASQDPLTTNKGFFPGLVEMFSNKSEHVVINEATLEKAKTELRNRVQAVLSGLMQCGVKGLPLDTQELIELYYDTYNPDTATRQQLKNFNDMTADVITKGEGQASQAHLRGELQ